MSEDQHAVAVGEESVALPDGVGVGAEDRFPAGKGADEHEKGGLGEVEVGEEPLDQAEAVAGREKDASGAGVRLERLTGLVRGKDAVLKGACGSGADGDDTAAVGDGGVDGFGGAGRKGVDLGVETDIGEVVHADGLKGAEADVQGEVLDLNVAGAELGEDVGSEVETGGGGGGGAVLAGLLGEDGLVTAPVFRAVRGKLVAVDVGWQGHVADLLDLGEEVRVGGEAEGSFAEATGRDDLGLQERMVEMWGGKEKVFADLNFAGGAAEGSPDDLAGVLRTEVFGEEDLDATGWVGRVGLGAEAGAGGEEAGGKDAGVVEDNEVAGAEVVGEVSEVIVDESSASAVEDEHAARSADGGWGLCDEVFWKIEVEVCDAHLVQFTAWRVQFLPWRRSDPTLFEGRLA